MKTKAEKEQRTQEIINSADVKNRLIMNELLEMGFSYAFTGTHYLHDSIYFVLTHRMESFTSVTDFCGKAGRSVCRKYGIKFSHYSPDIGNTIEWAFSNGNINYLLDTFKEAYNHERMSVTRNQFIMVTRQKILNELEKTQPCSGEQLKQMIQESVEKITDYSLLKGVCDIVLSLAGNI